MDDRCVGNKASRQERRRSERLANKANAREEKEQLRFMERAVAQRREEEKRSKKKSKEEGNHANEVYVQHFRPEDVQEMEPDHPMLFTGRVPDESEMTKLQKDKMMAAERFQSSMREQKGEDMDTAKKFFDDVANSNLTRYRDVVKEAHREFELETMALMRNEEEKMRKADDGNMMSIGNLISDNQDSI